MEGSLQLPPAPGVSESLTLTFGVELEFILRFNPVDYRFDHDCSHESCLHAEEFARKHMTSILVENGYPVYGHEERTSEEGSYFEKWDLGKDTSIHISELEPPPDEDRFGYSAVELRSPALAYTAASLLQVREVFDLLFSTFDILVNDSCGLHVHVGNEQKGFPLQTLKNFCILTTTFERELESLHPPSRIGNKHSLSSGTLFAGVSPWDMEKIIKSTHNEKDLIFRVQDSEKGYAYNLLNLLEYKKTIEFRQHEATVNVDDIVKWVEVACSLVMKAHDVAMEDYVDVDQTDLRRYHVDDCLDDTYSIPNRSILDVLAHLGLPELAEYYSTRDLYNHPRPSWAWADPYEEDAMAPWIESAHQTEDANDGEVDRSRRTQCSDGAQIIRSVFNSKENRDRYWDAVLYCASNTAIQIPCECDSAIGGGSWECFCDYWDFRSRAKSRMTPSYSLAGWNSEQDATESGRGRDESNMVIVQTKP